MLALGIDHEHAAGTGRKDIPLLVHFHAVRKTLLAGHQRKRVKEESAAVNRPVALDVVGRDGRSLGIGSADIKRLVIGAEGDAVREAQLLGQQHHFAAATQQENAAVHHFLLGIVHVPFEAVRRIGEVKIAVIVVHEVVRAVEPHVIVILGENGPAAILLEATDATVAMLREHQTAGAIGGQAVGARFAATGNGAGVTARLEERREAFALLPLENGVLGDVGENNVAAILDPTRTFGPGEAIGQDLDLRVGGDDVVERPIEPLNATERRIGVLAGLLHGGIRTQDRSGQSQYQTQ